MRIRLGSVLAATTATLLTGASIVALSPVGQASATVAVQNPSLEADQDSNGVPDCWQTNGWGTNTATYASVSDAHSGTRAEHIAISRYSSGAQRLLTQQSSACAPVLTAGHTYTLSGWYKSSGKAAWVALYESKSSGRWVYWVGGPILPSASSYTWSSFTTPAAPSDAGRISYGIALQSTGWLTSDDFGLVDKSASSPTPTPSASATTSPSPSPTSATASPTPTPVSTTASPTPTPVKTTTSPTPAPTTTSTTGGHTWYVSKTGNNADGASWSTAWNELANISWSVVKPGDRVVIDGGSSSCASDYDFANHATSRPGLSCGMMYTTAMTVKASGTSAAPITVELAQDVGRNGTVVIFGGRSTMLPYCDQTSYSPSGTPIANGISVPGSSNVVIDGRHRSGIMLYGAQDGVDLLSDSTSYITLRNMEIFDNGIFSTWSYGYKTDNEGISLVGHNITIDRDLIHDNGQDEIQDRYTSAVNNSSHAAMHDIAITNSWLYDHRESPLFPGFGFNAGAQSVASQNCTHVDGLQIWGGGLHQKNLTIDHDIFGPMIAQGVYPGDQDLASFDNVAITNTTFLNVLDHSIAGDSVSSDTSTPGGWTIAHDTSYMTTVPATGLASHGKVDLAGGGHSVTSSIFVNGYFATDSSFSSASGNVWSGGDPVLGGTNVNPGFAGPLPTTNTPSFATLTAMDLTPSCSACSGVGSPLHTTKSLYAQIDGLNATNP